MQMGPAASFLFLVFCGLDPGLCILECTQHVFFFWLIYKVPCILYFYFYGVGADFLWRISRSTFAAAAAAPVSAAA